MSLAKTDVLFAHIALHLTADLSAAARRVGSALIQHFNKQTGQCDPSIERLARMLKLSRASVLRATGELCATDAQGNSTGLFERVTHGGRSHRTAYLPRWDRLNEIVDDWNARMQTGDAPQTVSEVRPSRSQNCELDSLKPETQTFRKNLWKKPKGAVSLSARDPYPRPETSPNREASKGLGRKDRASSTYQPARPAVVPSLGAAKSDAAEAARQRRLQAHIQTLPRHEREAAWLRLIDVEERA